MSSEFLSIVYVFSALSLLGNNEFLFCRLYRAYQKLYASMHETGVGPHKTQFRRDENYGKMFLSSTRTNLKSEKCISVHVSVVKILFISLKII